MKKRLLMVDYRENGASKHMCIEIGQVGAPTDSDVVNACRICIGAYCELDAVFEVFADMTVEELEKIAIHPASMILPKRILYYNKAYIDLVRKGMSL